MDLKTIIPNETHAEFRLRVEQFYNYKLKPDDRWTLWGDLLIVCNRNSPPIMVHPGGKIEEITPTF